MCWRSQTWGLSFSGRSSFVSKSKLTLSHRICFKCSYMLDSDNFLAVVGTELEEIRSWIVACCFLNTWHFHSWLVVGVKYGYIYCSSWPLISPDWVLLSPCSLKLLYPCLYLVEVQVVSSLGIGAGSYVLIWLDIHRTANIYISISILLIFSDSCCGCSLSL